MSFEIIDKVLNDLKFQHYLPAFHEGNVDDDAMLAVVGDSSLHHILQNIIPKPGDMIMIMARCKGMHRNRLEQNSSNGGGSNANSSASGSRSGSGTGSTHSLESFTSRGRGTRSNSSSNEDQERELSRRRGPPIEGATMAFDTTGG